MALPLLPIVLGITGFAAIALPRLKSQPKALTTAEFKKDVAPGAVLPQYQPLPQRDPSKPSIVRVGRGVDAAMLLRSANPYDGVEPVKNYIEREVNRMQSYVQDGLMIAADSVRTHTMFPDMPPGPLDIFGPQETLTPGKAAALEVYWLTTARDIHFPPPLESKVFVEKFVLDPKGLSS